MNRILPLWPNEVPFSAQFPEQALPTLKEFSVEGSHGAIVLCPGGGYVKKAQQEGEPVAEMLNEAGISTYILDYRLHPCHYLAPLTDALRAIRIVRSMGYEKVGIMGFSAGGHLACCASTMYTPGDPDSNDSIEQFSSRPDALIACYAVVSLLAFSDLGTRISLLGDHASDPDLLQQFSTNLNVTKDTPPTFIWHTFTDNLVPVQSSLLLAEALASKGVPCEMHLYPEGRHGLGLAKECPRTAQWTKQCQSWLIAQGFAQ